MTQGLNLHLLKSPAMASGFFTTRAPWEARRGEESEVNVLVAVVSDSL